MKHYTGSDLKRMLKKTQLPTKGRSMAKHMDEIFVLTNEEKERKIKDATLFEFQKTQSRIDVETIAVQDFFMGLDTFTETADINFYQHYIYQYNIEKFLSKKGYKKVKDFYVRDGAYLTQARTIDVECSVNETFKAYSDAYVCFENKKNKHRLCIRTEKNYYANGAYFYEVYHSEEDLNFLKEIKEYSKINNFYKNQKIDAECSFLNIEDDIKWDDIILPEKTKNTIKNNIEKLVDIREALKDNNISLKRGVILSGPPGTGKTMTCKLLAKQMSTTVIYVLPSHIKSQVDVSRICDMAKELSPTLLILEDIDYLAKDRNSSNDWFVIDLMNKLDGIESFTDVITLATTNKVEEVEGAIKNRPGRFDRVINIPNPDEARRRQMIKNFMKSYTVKNLDENYILSKTKNLSGAYMKDLCITAVMNAIYDGSIGKNKKAIVTQEHFVQALLELKDKDFTRLSENFNSGPMGFGQEID